MKPVAQLVAEREASVTTVVSLIDQLETTYKDLVASTHDLTTHINEMGMGKKTGMIIPPVQGLDNIHTRMRLVLQWRLFGEGEGGTIDLAGIVQKENAACLREEVSRGR